jgi:hypothetical protein
MITTPDTIAKDQSDYLAAFNEATSEPDEESSAPPIKLAGVADWLKPSGDGVSAQMHAAMQREGVGPYGGDSARAKPTQAMQADSGVADQIRASKASDRQKQKDLLLEDIRKANPRGDQKAWNARAEEKLKALGY